MAQTSVTLKRTSITAADKEGEVSLSWFDQASQGLKPVTFQPTATRAWVAALPLNTHCKGIEHNESSCTQALSDDIPSMRKPNLQPLLPWEMHLLYVIVLFEAHSQRDISSTSVFGFSSFTPLLSASSGVYTREKGFYEANDHL